jgi:hypothetical protein
MSDETNDVGGEEVVDEVVEEAPDEGAEGALDTPDEGGEDDNGGEPVPDPAKAKPKEDEPPPKSYRTKINGKDEEIPADEVDRLAARFGVAPEDLLRGPASMLKAGQERFRKAAEVEKRARALEEQAKKDPIAALKMAGLSDEDVQKATIAYLAKMYEEDELRKNNPTEFRARQLEAEIAKRDEAEQTRQQQADEEKVRTAQTETVTKLNDELTGILKAGKIAPTPYAVSRMAAHLLEHAKAVEAGEAEDDLTPADFVPLVEEDLRKEHSKLYGEMTGEQFVHQFPEMAEKIRKYHVDGVRRPRTPGNQPEARPRPSREQKTYQSVGAVLRDL